MPPDTAIVAIPLAILWMVGAFSRAAVRGALMNGLRCAIRYPDLWRIPALFGVGYATFQLAATAILHLRLHETFPLFAWSPPPPPAGFAVPALLPAAERTAAVFTIFTATFPLSAWFALLFLFNSGGLLTELARALRKRLGPAAGLLVTAALVLTALAAIAKPAVYLLLPEIAERVPVLVPMAVNFLSCAFELILGIFFLTYLMLMSHAWLRGLHFHRSNLRLVAMRRTGFVLKWSLLIVALASLLVMLPVYIGLLFAPGEPFDEGCEWFSTWIGRPAITAVALFYCPAQAILVFHNESLRQALREARQLFIAHLFVILPFLGAGYAAFLALEIAADTASACLGGETLAALGSRALAAFVEALLAGWLIASWVCLYKSLSARRKEIPF
ncbi:MAG: hypothetical protein PHC88_15880 [Terrimicrobiaceae bacterium]|nr:hypothetical protein [Terrimicrobiaceae bacterium]